MFVLVCIGAWYCCGLHSVGCLVGLLPICLGVFEWLLFVVLCFADDWWFTVGWLGLGGLIWLPCCARIGAVVDFGCLIDCVRDFWLVGVC